MKSLIYVAAQEIGVSPRTLNQWAKNGRIKFTRSPGGWRLFDDAEIARLKAELKARKR